MTVSYSKEAREHAKANELALFAVEVDGRPSKDGLTGRYTSEGPLEIDMARALFFFAQALANGDGKTTPKAAFDRCFPNGKPMKTRIGRRRRS